MTRSVFQYVHMHMMICMHTHAHRHIHRHTHAHSRLHPHNHSHFRYVHEHMRLQKLTHTHTCMYMSRSYRNVALSLHFALLSCCIGACSLRHASRAQDGVTGNSSICRACNQRSTQQMVCSYACATPRAAGCDDAMMQRTLLR